MDFITDEVLFYGGAAAAALSLAAAFLYVCIAQVKRIRLNARLDEEYGKEEKKDAKKRCAEAGEGLKKRQRA